MMYGRWLAKALAVLTLLMVAGLSCLPACRRADKDLPDVSVDLKVSPEPPQVGEVMVTVVLGDADGVPISGAEMALEGTMTHAGMKPVFADARETAPGQYEAALEFTMGGDWVIIVRATLPDGRSLEREIDVPGVQVP
jgi:hypothetical protein